jgi:predicted negative regulator of RcsB-dependent stress response
MNCRSERQHLLEKEHDDMMDKLNKVAKEDFDNTKRIERPEEVLARRRKEREARNAWYKRVWRRIRGQEA